MTTLSMPSAPQKRCCANGKSAEMHSTTVWSRLAALLKTAQDHDSPVRIVEATVAVNDNRKRAIGRKVISAMGGNARGKTVAVLGLTFKPNTDDMREAPSIAIVQTLQAAGARVRAHDPEGMAQARRVIEIGK